MLIMIIFADVLGLCELQDKTVLCYIHTLQSQVPSARVLGRCKLPGITLCYIHTLQNKISYSDVLGLWQLQDITLLHYIQKLQSQIPYAHVLRLCNIRTKLYCVIHITLYNKSCPIAISFSVLPSSIGHVSEKLLQLHHDYTEKTFH